MSDQQQAAYELLQDIVGQLADRPDDVHIEKHETEHAVMCEIHVHDSDVGKVLGKRGDYADALRTLFGAIYGKHKKSLHLVVVDPRHRR